MTPEEREQLASTERANERMLNEIRALSARIEAFETVIKEYLAWAHPNICEDREVRAIRDKMRAALKDDANG